MDSARLLQEFTRILARILVIESYKNLYKNFTRILVRILVMILVTNF